MSSRVVAIKRPAPPPADPVARVAIPAGACGPADQIASHARTLSLTCCGSFTTAGRLAALPAVLDELERLTRELRAAL